MTKCAKDSGHYPQPEPSRDKMCERFWTLPRNRIPDDVRREIVDLALEKPELSPRELAVKFTDTKGYFVSEASVYRLLKAHDLITSPAFVVIKGGGCVQGQDDGPEPALADGLHLLQGHRLGLVVSVNDPGRLFPLHHRLETVHDHAGRGRHRDAEAGAGSLRLRPRRRRAQTTLVERQWLIVHLRRPGGMARDNGMDHVRGAPNHPQTQGKIERWHQTLKNRILLENYFLPGDLEGQINAFVGTTTTIATTKASESHPRRRLLRAGPRHHQTTKGNQGTDNPKPPLAPSAERGLTSISEEPKTSVIQPTHMSQMF